MPTCCQNSLSGLTGPGLIAAAFLCFSPVVWGAASPNGASAMPVDEHAESTDRTTSSDEKLSAEQLFELITKPAPVPQIAYRAEKVGALANPRLNEASGIAQSRRDANIFWAHNDSGSGPYLFALNQHGEDVARLLLNKVRPRDWEDMSAFTWHGQPWLVVADSGDNKSQRKTSKLYLLREPGLRKTKAQQLLKQDIDLVVEFSYPDAPADTEAVAVDEQAQVVYLLTNHSNRFAAIVRR